MNFIHGPYYVQLTLFSDGADPLAAAAAMAGHLEERIQGAELAFRFPDLGEVKATRFVREDYHGLEFFDRVIERGFERDGVEINAFVISGTAAEITTVKDSLSAFLSDDGIPFETIERGGLRPVVVDDPYEGSWFYLPLMGEGSGQLLGVYADLDEGMVEALSEFAQSSLSDNAGTERAGMRSD